MAKFLSEEGLRYFYNQIKSKFAAASHNHSAGNITSGTLPIARGGTGATTVANAVKALLGTSALGSSTKPIYYDGAALKACADSIGGGGIVAANLNTNGYVKFANGLILQWGHWSGGLETSTTITFPVAFSSACYSITVTSNYNSTGSKYCDYIDRVLWYNKSQFGCFVNTNAFFWIAIGR